MKCYFLSSFLCWDFGQSCRSCSVANYFSSICDFQTLLAYSSSCHDRDFEDLLTAKVK